MYLRGFLQGIPGKIHESFVLSVIRRFTSSFHLLDHVKKWEEIVP